MHKFKNKTKGNYNQTTHGDGSNYQDNRKIVNNYNNYSVSSRNKNEEAMAIFIGLGIGLLVAILAFYKYSDSIFQYLNIAALISGIFSPLALIFLFIDGNADGDDYITSMLSFCFAIFAFFLSLFAKQQIPVSIIELSRTTQGFEFFTDLSTYGRKIVFSSFFAALFIVFSLIGNFLIGAYHFSYALAYSEKNNIWYKIYNWVDSFTLKTLILFMISCFLVLSYVASSRILLSS